MAVDDVDWRERFVEPCHDRNRGRAQLVRNRTDVRRVDDGAMTECAECGCQAADSGFGYRTGHSAPGWVIRTESARSLTSLLSSTPPGPPRRAAGAARGGARAYISPPAPGARRAPRSVAPHRRTVPRANAGDRNQRLRAEHLLAVERQQRLDLRFQGRASRTCVYARARATLSASRSSVSFVPRRCPSGRSRGQGRRRPQTRTRSPPARATSRRQRPPAPGGCTHRVWGCTLRPHRTPRRRPRAARSRSTVDRRRPAGEIVPGQQAGVDLLVGESAERSVRMRPAASSEARVTCRRG